MSVIFLIGAIICFIFAIIFLFVMADEQFGKSDSFVRCLMSIIFFAVFICCFIFNLYSIERQNKIKVTLYEGYKNIEFLSSSRTNGYVKLDDVIYKYECCGTIIRLTNITNENNVKVISMK